MIKTLAVHIKGFIRESLLTPLFMVLEVVMETIIPLLMATMIDDGINKGNMQHIIITGLWMLLCALIALFAGFMGGVYGAKASAGFAKNLRLAMFENIQSFSFANIDKYSTAGLVTRMTTDVTNIQNSYQMLLRIRSRQPHCGDDNGDADQCKACERLSDRGYLSCRRDGVHHHPHLQVFQQGV